MVVAFGTVIGAVAIYVFTRGRARQLDSAYQAISRP